MRGLALVLAGAVAATVSPAAQGDRDAHRRLHALGAFPLESGAVLSDAKMAFATVGQINADRSNVILLPSWYSSDHHGYDFLIGSGRALDPAKYFIVQTEMFANGWSSSPSNTPEPLHGPRFPAVAIRDDVEAARRLLASEFGVTRVRAIIGYSMGAQQALQWAVSHPDFTDQIVAYCGTAKTYPHGVVRLESAISAMTAAGDFAGGDYAAPPVTGLAAWSDHWTAWTRSQEWFRLELFKPAAPTVEEFLRRQRAYWGSKDANDLIAQARTWQRHNVADTPGMGGDLAKALGSIRSRVLYMPCSTDLYFPQGDFEYERGFIRTATLVAIPSNNGHLAGSGALPADSAFINEQISRVLR